MTSLEAWKLKMDLLFGGGEGGVGVEEWEEASLAGCGGGGGGCWPSVGTGIVVVGDEAGVFRAFDGRAG